MDRPLHNHTDEMLLELRRESEDKLAAAKAALAMISAEFTARHKDALEAAFDRAEKLSGELTIDHPTIAGRKIRGEVKKTVKWDSGKLQTLAAALPWEFVRKHFKVELGVPEKAMPVMEAVLSAQQMTALRAARTVKFSDIVATVE